MTDSTIASVRRPLEQNLERQEYMPQRAGPRFLLAELLLHGRLPNFVLRDPAREEATWVSSHVRADRREWAARTDGESPPAGPVT